MEDPAKNDTLAARFAGSLNFNVGIYNDFDSICRGKELLKQASPSRDGR